MKSKLILLPVLLMICFAAFSQEKQARKAKKSEAVVEKGLIKVSVMYPFAEGKTFDIVYYETKHMPMVAILLKHHSLFKVCSLFDSI